MNGNQPVTRHQTTREIYLFLWNYHQDTGLIPSHQEIADALYLARSAVSRHLDKLAAWGWIVREEGRARSIRLLKTPEELGLAEPIPKM